MTRIILLLFISLTIHSCSDVETVARIPKYEYPRDSLRTGKRFIYKKIVSSEPLYDSVVFMNRKIIEEDGRTFFVLETGEPGQPIRTRDKFETLPEGYKYSESVYFLLDSGLAPKPLRSKIVMYRSFPDKYRGVATRLKMNFEGVNMESKTTETFLREDSLVILGKKRHAITFQVHTVIISKGKFSLFQSNESVIDGEYTVAEGLDLVRFSNNMRGTNEVWKLVSIEDLNQ